MQNFFSYQIKTDALPQGEQVYKLRADAEDREKIREILKIPGVKLQPRRTSFKALGPFGSGTCFGKRHYA